MQRDEHKKSKTAKGSAVFGSGSFGSNKIAWDTLEKFASTPDRREQWLLVRAFILEVWEANKREYGLAILQTG